MTNDKKLAPEVRFKGFLDDWEQRKLEEVSESFSGGTPLVSKREFYGGNIPFIRSAEINEECTELFLSDKGLDNSSAKKVNKGDILYALYGATSGEVGISKINGAINQAILAIIPKENYSSYFIVEYLKKEKKNIIDKYLQGGQGNLSASIIKQLDVKFPIFSEQTKIGKFFSKFDSLITLQQEKIEKLKELKRGYLEKLFPKHGKNIPEIRFEGFNDVWEEKKLGEVFTNIPSRNYIKEVSISGEIPIIQQGDTPIIGFSSGNPYISYENVVLFGDHTLSLYNPHEPFFIATDGIKILESKNLNNDFFYTLLNYSKPNSQGYKRHFTILKNQYTRIALDVEEQSKIGSFFSNLDKQVKSEESKLENLKLLKKEYLRKMFI